MSAPFDLGAHEEIALSRLAVLRAEEANFEMVINGREPRPPGAWNFLDREIRPSLVVIAVDSGQAGLRNPACRRSGPAATSRSPSQTDWDR